MSIVLATTIIGMGLIAVIGNALAGAALMEQSLARIGETTALKAGDIDAWVIKQTRYLEAIASGFSSASDVGPPAIFPELVAHADRNGDYFSVYAGYPNGIGVFNDEWEPDYNEWRANEREWYRGAAAAPNDVFITDLYVDAESGEFCLTFAKAFTNNGAMAGVVAIDIFTTVLSDLVDSVIVGKDSYAFMTAGNGDIMAHPNSGYLPTVDADEETVFQNIAGIESGHYAGLSNRNVSEAVRLRGMDGVLRYYTARAVPSTGWILYSAIPVSIVDAPIRRQITAAAVIFTAVLIAAGTFIYFALIRFIVRPVKSVTEAANMLARGETGARLDGHYVGEIAQLADSFRGMEAFNRQQTEWLEHIAAGDLSVDVIPRGSGDRIGQAISEMLENLNGMFLHISGSTHKAASGAKYTANNSQELARGAAEQAAAIAELSSAVGKITDKANRSASIAKEASELSGNILRSAEKGNRQMDQMMLAVREINDASRSIGKVIKAIDDIAFQTNILALNAAVEAARAGQHGKGFAVVAEEVRSLAAKSAEAAKDTEGLIENSIQKANLGLGIANETADSLREIVEGIHLSAEAVERIARTSDEEAKTVGQINTSIDQISQVTQQNSATAEESAAASEEMSEQSDELEQLISQFKLSGRNPMDARPALPGG